MALLAALVLLLLLPAFNGKLSHNDDWRRLCALAGAARKTLLECRAFPFRSHYFGGGYPTIAEPEDPACSPFFAFVLAFGEAAGLKLRALLCALAAAAGMFHLARRRLGFNRWGGFAAAGPYPGAMKTRPAMPVSARRMSRCVIR